MKADLPTRAQQAFDRCKLFPETSPDGFMAMIELRNMMPEIIGALLEKQR